MLTDPRSSQPSSTSKPPFSHHALPSITDPGLQLHLPEQRHYARHRLRLSFRHAAVRTRIASTLFRGLLTLTGDTRAFDTSSDRIWDSVNRGVRDSRRTERMMEANGPVAAMEGHQVPLRTEGRGRWR